MQGIAIPERASCLGVEVVSCKVHVPTVQQPDQGHVPMLLLSGDVPDGLVQDNSISHDFHPRMIGMGNK
jgi:hypothetical protein